MTTDLDLNNNGDMSSSPNHESSPSSLTSRTNNETGSSAWKTGESESPPSSTIENSVLPPRPPPSTIHIDDGIEHETWKSGGSRPSTIRNDDNGGNGTGIGLPPRPPPSTIRFDNRTEYDTGTGTGTGSDTEKNENDGSHLSSTIHRRPSTPSISSRQSTIQNNPSIHSASDFFPAPDNIKQGTPDFVTIGNKENRHRAADFFPKESQSTKDDPSFVTKQEEGNEIEEIFDWEAMDEDEEQYIVRLLARRAFHLPNHNWGQDWLQWMKNNHPLLGLFFHHKLHPLRIEQRVYILITSIAFGLLATNCVYLYYVFNDENMEEVVIEIQADGPLQLRQIDALQVTYGMISTLTFAGILHTGFDLSVWFLSACACFLQGKYSKYHGVGHNLVIILAAMLSATSIFVALMRCVIDTRLRLAEEGILLGDFNWNELGNIQSVSFIRGYFLELFLVYCFYFPVCVTGIFSGVVPCIGRNREMGRQLYERKHRFKIYNDNGTIAHAP